MVKIGSNEEKIEATITDLSSGGAGILVSADVEMTSRDKLTLFAKDSYGQEYTLPLSITRLAAAPSGLSIGTRFEVQDKKVLRSVIGFVYGDSYRWKYFFERTSQSNVNSLSGFGYLVKIGLKGSIRNFIGMLGMIWRGSFSWLTKLIISKRQAAE